MLEKLGEPTYSNNVRDRLISLFQQNKNAGYRDIQRVTGLDRKKIERSMNEGRKFREEEVELLAAYFEIPFARLSGKEYYEVCNEINSHTQEKNFEKSLEKSIYLRSISLTKNEDRIAVFKIAESHLGLKNYSESTLHLRAIIDCANIDNELLIESRHLHLKSLILSGEYEEVQKLCRVWFLENRTNSLSHLAKIKHFEGMSYFYQDKKDKAKMCYLQSVDIHKQQGDKDSRINAARLQANVADIEFHSGRVVNSLKLLRDAENIQIETSDNFEQILITRKDMARCLIVLDRTDEALQLIRDSIGQFEKRNIKNNELKGKFLLMFSDVSGELIYSEQLLGYEGVSPELKVCTADFIVANALKGGDLPKTVDIMYCYKVVRDYVGYIFNYREGVWF